jgi:hypothetical protein
VAGRDHVFWRCIEVWARCLLVMRHVDSVRKRTYCTSSSSSLSCLALPCPSPTQSCPFLGFRVRLSPGIAGCRRPCALSWPCIRAERRSWICLRAGTLGRGWVTSGRRWPWTSSRQLGPASCIEGTAAAAAAAATTDTSRTPSARWNPPFANDAQILNSFNYDCGIFLSGLSSPRSIPLSGPPRHLPSAAAQSHSSPPAVNLGKRSSSSPRSLDDRC